MSEKAGSIALVTTAVTTTAQLFAALAEMQKFRPWERTALISVCGVAATVVVVWWAMSMRSTSVRTVAAVTAITAILSLTVSFLSLVDSYHSIVIDHQATRAAAGFIDVRAARTPTTTRITLTALSNPSRVVITGIDTHDQQTNGNVNARQIGAHIVRLKDFQSPQRVTISYRLSESEPPPKIVKRADPSTVSFIDSATLNRNRCTFWKLGGLAWLLACLLVLFWFFKSRRSAPLEPGFIPARSKTVEPK